MPNEPVGYSTSSSQEQIEALNGRVMALEIAFLHITKAIADGYKGDDARQFIASGLRADAEQFKSAPVTMMKAANSHLHVLAGWVDKR